MIRGPKNSSVMRDGVIKDLSDREHGWNKKCSCEKKVESDSPVSLVGVISSCCMAYERISFKSNSQSEEALRVMRNSLRNILRGVYICEKGHQIHAVPFPLLRQNFRKIDPAANHDICTRTINSEK